MYTVYWKILSGNISTWSVWVKPTFELLVTHLSICMGLHVWPKAFPMDVCLIVSNFTAFLVTSIGFLYLWIMFSNQRLVYCTMWLDNINRQNVSMLSSTIHLPCLQDSSISSSWKYQCLIGNTSRITLLITQDNIQLTSCLSSHIS